MRSWACCAISAPWSHVSDRRSCSGSVLIDDAMASRTALAPCPASAGPFLTGGVPCISMRGRCSAGAGRPGGGHRVVRRRHPCLLADVGRAAAGGGGGGAGDGRRGAARATVAVGLGALAAFAAAPVLGAVVGGVVGGLQALAGHTGHVFADDQGAWAILPAFQVGLFAALWIAVAGGGRSWRRALAGLGGVVLVQAAFGVPVGELAHHYGFDPPRRPAPRLGAGAPGGGGLVARPAPPRSPSSSRRPRPARCCRPADGPKGLGETAKSAGADGGPSLRPATRIKLWRVQRSFRHSASIITRSPSPCAGSGVADGLWPANRIPLALYGRVPADALVGASGR